MRSRASIIVIFNLFSGLFRRIFFARASIDTLLDPDVYNIFSKSASIGSLSSWWLSRRNQRVVALPVFSSIWRHTAILFWMRLGFTFCSRCLLFFLEVIMIKVIIAQIFLVLEFKILLVLCGVKNNCNLIFTFLQFWVIFALPKRLHVNWLNVVHGFHMRCINLITIDSLGQLVSVFSFTFVQLIAEVFGLFCLKNALTFSLA